MTERTETAHVVQKYIVRSGLTQKKISLKASSVFTEEVLQGSTDWPLLYRTEPKVSLAGYSRIIFSLSPGSDASTKITYRIIFSLRPGSDASTKI